MNEMFNAKNRLNDRLMLNYKIDETGRVLEAKCICRLYGRTSSIHVPFIS